MRVAIATCLVLPEPDHDQDLLLTRLRGADIDAFLLAWDDPSARSEPADLCVIRSTWNYHLHRPAFLAWAEKVSARMRLCNPLPVVKWNTHKSYLRTLAEKGIRVIPTCFLDAGATARLSTIMAERGWCDVVVKPTVSAASFQTRRFTQRDRECGNTFLAELLRERDAMVQPYIHSVDSSGERAIIWIDGEVTHSIHKTPRFDGGNESVSDTRPATAQERSFAAKVLATVDDDLLYGRVDVACADDGSLMVMELELVEPSLYLARCRPALDRLVAGIRVRLERR